MNSMSSLVVKATEAMTDALREVRDGSWEVSAGDLEWSCRDTAAHVADDLFSYASQVIAQPTEGYLPIEAVIDPSASNVEILAAVAMCGRLLANAVELADPAARGWHPQGTSDPDGFAAMGVVEVLVHTFDIANGLGLDWRPPAALCEPVLQRLFPQAPNGDPVDVLLYCCGREPLEELPRLSEWTWDSSTPGNTSTKL
jgi:uncharacterized protein (TIGR03083 family)